jgi:hypothetical protein
MVFSLKASCTKPRLVSVSENWILYTTICVLSSQKPLEVEKHGISIKQKLPPSFLQEHETSLKNVTL